MVQFSLILGKDLALKVKRGVRSFVTSNKAFLPLQQTGPHMAIVFEKIKYFFCKSLIYFKIHLFILFLGSFKCTLNPFQAITARYDGALCLAEFNFSTFGPGEQ